MVCLLNTAHLLIVTFRQVLHSESYFLALSSKFYFPADQSCSPSNPQLYRNTDIISSPHYVFNHLLATSGICNATFLIPISEKSLFGCNCILNEAAICNFDILLLDLACTVLSYVSVQSFVFWTEPLRVGCGVGCGDIAYISEVMSLYYHGYLQEVKCGTDSRYNCVMVIKSKYCHFYGISIVWGQVNKSFQCASKTIRSW